MSGILPGYSIPYALTFDEILQFLNDNANNQTLQNYLDTCDPPYGVVVHYQGYAPGYGDMVVWQDQSHECGDKTGLHVIDCTGMNIVSQIQLAPYQSPDPGIIQNMIDQVKALAKELAKQTQGTVNLALVAA